MTTKHPNIWLVIAVFYAMEVIFIPQGLSMEASIQDPAFKAAVLMDADSGTILYQKNMHQRLQPASLAKLMLILMIFEKGSQAELDFNDTITVSARASKMGGSQVYLKHFEVFTVRQLLDALIIHSANDAAVALAEHIAGSDGQMVSLMNKRAGEMGLKNTIFHSVHGLPPGKGQQPDLGSAYDLALICQRLVKYPMVLKLASTYRKPFRDGKFILSNSNKLINDYDGADGLKTGYHSKAGFCLAATAKRGDMRLIAITLGIQEKKDWFNQTRRLLDFGFDHFTRHRLAKQEQVIARRYPIKINETGKTNYFDLVAMKDAWAVVRKIDVSRISRKIVMETEPALLKSPGYAPEPVGSLIFYLNGQQLSSVPLLLKASAQLPQ